MEADLDRGTCPACGSGDVTHIVFGMAVPEAMEKAPRWVRFAGCVKFGHEPNRACESCGNNWIESRRPVSDEPPSRRRRSAVPLPPWHPRREHRTPSSDPGETVVWTLRELLDATDCATADDLADTLDNHFDLDAYLEHADDTSVDVRIETRGVTFEYPFTVSEFWEGVSDLEDEAAAELESNHDD